MFETGRRKRKDVKKNKDKGQEDMRQMKKERKKSPSQTLCSTVFTPLVADDDT